MWNFVGCYLDMLPEGDGVAELSPAGDAAVETAPHGPRLVGEGRGEGHRDVVLHRAFESDLFSALDHVEIMILIQQTNNRNRGKRKLGG